MADQSEYTSAPPRRKKLVLQPRSVGTGSAPASSSRSGDSNPFGAAKPREEVLAKKGIDSKLVDARIEKKVTPVRFTRDQETQVENLRDELTKLEEELREANEKELPEEKLRVASEAKRKELNELIAKFTELNAASQEKTPDSSGAAPGSYSSSDRQPQAGARQKFERPSERRKRLNQQQNDNDGGNDNNQSSYNSNPGGRGYGGNRSNNGGFQQDDVYSSFGGRSNQNYGDS